MACHGNAPLLQKLQGQGPGKAEGCGKAAGKLAAAPDIVAFAVLHPSRVVGVGGPGGAAQALIVLAVLVTVVDHGGQWRTAEGTVYHAGEDLRRVRFLPLSGPGIPSRGPTGHKSGHPVHIRPEARRQALHHAANGLGMGLAEYSDTELMPQGVHG